MSKNKKHNQGFSLIELLIALTILSIVMIMVVQFMSTSTAAYKKNKKNLSIQTEAMKVLEQMSDTLMQAKYVRVATKDKGIYTITKTDVGTKNERTVQVSSADTVKYDFVPDTYGNYALNCDYTTTNRKAIVNFDTFQIVNKENKPYPLELDKDSYDTDGNKVVMDYRSFRALKPSTDFLYVKPEFIYAEYSRQGVTVHVIYYITDITDSKDNTCSIYMYRYETDDSVAGAAASKNYYYAKKEVLALLGKSATPTKGSGSATQFTSNTETQSVINTIKAGAKGMLTDKISDFYLSADTEGNAFLTNILFKDGNYNYNTAETINFRNSNVLTARPQKLYKYVSGSSGGGASGGSTSTENNSSTGTNATTGAASTENSTKTP